MENTKLHFLIAMTLLSGNWKLRFSPKINPCLKFAYLGVLGTDLCQFPSSLASLAAIREVHGKLVISGSSGRFFRIAGSMCALSMS